MHHIRSTEPKIAHRLELIEPLVYRQRRPLSPFRFHAGDERLVVLDVDDGDWPVIKPGDYWGKLRQGFTLRTTFTVPTDYQSPVSLFFPLGHTHEFINPEVLAYIDGQANQGVNVFHQEILLLSDWCDGATHLLALHGWVGIGKVPVLMGQPEIVQIHQPTRDFVAAVREALGVLRELDERDPSHSCLLNVLDAAFRRLDLREPFGDNFYKSIETALQILEEDLVFAGPSLAVDVIATGHTYIDVAWLWPLYQTRHKAVRSFSSVLP